MAAKLFTKLSLFKTAPKLLSSALFYKIEPKEDTSLLFSDSSTRSLIYKEELTTQEWFSKITYWVRTHSGKISAIYVASYIAFGMVIIIIAKCKGLTNLKTLALIFSPLKIYVDLTKYIAEARIARKSETNEIEVGNLNSQICACRDSSTTAHGYY